MKRVSTEPGTAGTGYPNCAVPPHQHDIQKGDNPHEDKRNQDKRDSLNKGDAEQFQAANDEKGLENECEVADQRVGKITEETGLPEESDVPVAQGQPRSSTDCPDIPLPDDAYADITLPQEDVPDVQQLPTVHVSPPGGSSQKENQGAQNATPVITRPQHGRVKVGHSVASTYLYL